MIIDSLNKKQFQGRISSIVERMNTAGIKEGIIALFNKLDRETDPYEQDSNLVYLLGRGGYDISLVDAITVDIESGKTTIYGSEGSVVREGSGFRFSPADIAETFNATSSKSILEVLNKSGSKIYTVPELYDGWKVELGNNSIDYVLSNDVIQALTEERLIKSADEIEKLKSANDLTAELHNFVMETVRAGMSERQVNAEIKKYLEERGAAPSFNTIVTTNGAILHNVVKRSEEMDENSMLLIDVGAMMMNNQYRGDQTSTFPVGKEFSVEQKEVYTIVYQAHKEALNACKQGVSFKEVHSAACRELIRGLIKLGVLQGEEDELLLNGAYTAFFPHGVGHAIGLDTHDMGDHNQNYTGFPKDQGHIPSTRFGDKSLRFARNLERGHCFTIEPGLYFNPEIINDRENGKNSDRYPGIDLSAVKQYIDFDKARSLVKMGGIRYEECYYIEHKTGNTQLLGNKKKYSTIKEIEEARKKAYI